MTAGRSDFLGSDPPAPFFLSLYHIRLASNLPCAKDYRNDFLRFLSRPLSGTPELRAVQQDVFDSEKMLRNELAESPARFRSEANLHEKTQAPVAVA